MRKRVREIGDRESLKYRKMQVLVSLSILDKMERASIAVQLSHSVQPFLFVLYFVRIHFPSKYAQFFFLFKILFSHAYTHART